MFLNKKLLTIIGAAGLALGASACSSSGSGLYGVCTTTETDGSASCAGTTNIDYGTAVPDVIPPGTETPQETCEAAGNVWSDNCATQTVCVVETTVSTVVATTEIGSTADDDTTAVADDLLAFVCAEAVACDLINDTDIDATFTSNVAAVQTTDGTDGDCAL